MADTEVYFSCQGHPAWPDPLRRQSFAEASDWYDEHVIHHPNIRVVEVVVQSRQIIPLPPVPPRGRPNS